MLIEKQNGAFPFLALKAVESKKRKEKSSIPSQKTSLEVVV